MNSNQNQSYSLLSQEEIDVLVSFLIDKKSAVDSDVMSQQSIDKLIYLITNENTQVLNLLDPFAKGKTDRMTELNLRKEKDQVCELRVSLAENGFIELTAVNLSTEETLKITPQIFNQSDDENWGYSISPVTLNRVAIALGLKYSTQTNDFVKKVFAKSNFGDENHVVPAIHQPVNVQLLEALL